MEQPGTFSKNISKGINLRLKKMFDNPYRAVNVNWVLHKYLKHLPPGRIHSHQLFGHKTFFNGGPEYLHGLKEIFIEGVYYQQLPANASIIDCGSHIGLSVIYFKRICPSANITAFEPDLKNFSLLQKNISSHHLTGVIARNEAVWIENTTLDFIEDGNMGSKIGAGNASNTKSVNATRLKDLLDKQIDFLKLDIEGAEYEVVKDISGNLGNVANFFIEYHGNFEQNHQLLEMLGLLTDAAFSFYIKEATVVYPTPFLRNGKGIHYDVQLNIFCFRTKGQ
jgi:FkbM family methyltransferase